VLFVNLRGVPAEDRAALVAARRLGCAVDLVAPSLPAHAAGLVRRFHAADTDDHEHGLAAARALARRATAGGSPPSGVLTWGDRGVELTALVADELGLPAPSPQAAHRARHKPSMREAASRVPGLVGRHHVVRDRADLEVAVRTVGFPAVLKPAAAAGSMGIFEVGSLDAARAAFDELSGWVRAAPRAWRGDHEDGELLFDEYLDGPEFSVEGWVHDGAVTVAGVTDKVTTEPFHLELQHLHPSGRSVAQLDVLRRGTQDVVRAVGLDHCAFHLEAKLTTRGFRLLEVAARPAGDYIASHLVPLSTGVDFHAGCIRVACGQPPLVDGCRENGGCEGLGLVAGVRFVLADGEGTFAGLERLPEVLQHGEVEHVLLEIPLGTAVRLPPSDYDTQRVAAVIARGPDHAAVTHTLDVAARQVRPIIDGPV